MAANNVFKELEKGSYTGLKRCISLYPTAVSLKNPAGQTALHIAAQQGKAAFVKELLVHGAQHDATDTRGNTPLHLAAEQGSVEAVAELISGRKASVKAKNKDGQTPLHMAVLGGHKAVVSKLLETGIQADALKDKAGNTPLSLVDPSDTDLQQIFANARPLGTVASINQGLGIPLSTFGPDAAPSTQRAAPASGAATPISSHSGRLTMSPAPSLAGGMGGGAAAGTPATPPHRGMMGGTPAGGRTPSAATINPSGMHAGGRTPPPAPSGALTSRVPRNMGSVAASPAHSGGGAAPEQLHKHDLAIQSLREGLRAATERLGALDACTTAQLECAGQVEKALEACGNHGRAILDLEARVAFQEDRGRDTRSRVERLEEGERDRQDSVKRLSDEQRSLHSQLQRLADQVSANGAALRHASSADAASHMQANPQLQADVAVLRAQLDQLSPALALATAASAEIRTLAARIDVMQQQLQQQQPHVGGGLVLEQQVLQLQAQVQLLQLPVANLTQQCADMSSRMGGFAEWQQQARADFAKLAEAAAAAQQNAGSRAGLELSDAVMLVLDTTARTLAEQKATLDQHEKKIDVLQKEYDSRQQQQVAVPASPPPPSGPPAVPGTPQSASQRVSGAGDPLMTPLGGPPSRNGPHSMARDSVAQAELRAELESLKSLMADLRKEVATEGGSLRREWQRAFSDMQSRYGEQTNELRAREANIAKLREAALVEEAERRAASGFEEKFTARLGKLETSVEYLTHRLEVLEEQVSGVVSTLTGAPSPVVPPSPGRMAAALASMRSQPVQLRRGPGPVSENHSGFVVSASELAAAVAAAAAMPASARGSASPASARGPASPKQGRFWSMGGPTPAVTPGAAGAVQSDGGCLRRRIHLLSATGAKDSGTPRAGGGSAEGSAAASPASARGVGSAPDASDRRLGPDEWWRAADAEPPESLEASAVPPAARASQPPSAQGTGGGAPVLPLPPGLPAAERATAEEAMATGQGAMPTPQIAAFTVTSEAADAQHPSPAGAATPRSVGEAPATAAAGRDPSPACLMQLPPPQGRRGFSQSSHEVPSPGAEPGSPASGPPSARGPLSARGQATPTMHTMQQGVGVGPGLLDPAHVALGPQLLTPMAQALLAPSVDIQRLAAAAAAAQQQLQQQHYSHTMHQQPFLEQQQAPAMQLWSGGQQQPMLAGQTGSPARGVGGRSAEVAGGTPGTGRPAAASADGRGERQGQGVGPGAGPARKEPPMCLYCPMQ